MLRRLSSSTYTQASIYLIIYLCTCLERCADLGKGNVARRELSTDKTRRLERIGIVWGPVQAQWEDKFA
jgi:hypothetical protein